jgi:hypothetical protein
MNSEMMESMKEAALDDVSGYPEFQREAEELH